MEKCLRTTKHMSLFGKYYSLHPIKTNIVLNITHHNTINLDICIEYITLGLRPCLDSNFFLQTFNFSITSNFHTHINF